MARPQKPPFLIPRQPKTVLSWTMQKQREVHGWSVKRTANAYGCSASHISRVEHGSIPSRGLAQFYDDAFGSDGLVMSLFETAIYAPEQERRRARGQRPQLRRARPGDASEFVGDKVPHGMLMEPGQFFMKTWHVRNSGTVTWKDRRLERQGPKTGPGLITSPEFVLIPATEPGAVAEITTPLKAPTYDCTSIAYFKMVDADGFLCFPENYMLGLDVLVLVRGQVPDRPTGLDDRLVVPGADGQVVSPRSLAH